ncbi:MAG: MFS transporter, partial [Chloroflexi bacterium HGW-Chloroflexi-8]
MTAERKQEIVNQKRPAISIKALGSALRRPVVGNLLHTRLIYGFAFALFQSIFALYGQYRFNLNSQNIGYILAFVGVLSAITQGFVIGKLSDRFADRQLIFFSVSTISASMLAWALAPNVIFLIIVLAPIAVSAGILNTIINAALTKAVPPSEFG